MPTGKIKVFVERKGYGFIIPDLGGPEVFFHETEVNSGAALSSGMPVSYSFGPGNNGRDQAIGVKPI